MGITEEIVMGYGVAIYGGLPFELPDKQDFILRDNINNGPTVMLYDISHLIDPNIDQPQGSSNHWSLRLCEDTGLYNRSFIIDNLIASIRESGVDRTFCKKLEEFLLQNSNVHVGKLIFHYFH